MELGFWIPIVSGNPDSLSCILNPDSFTWRDYEMCDMRTDADVPDPQPRSQVLTPSGRLGENPGTRFPDLGGLPRDEDARRFA